MRLRKPCSHGRYDAHDYDIGLGLTLCPGGEFLAEDTLVIEKNELGRWPKWAKKVIHEWFTGPDSMGEHPASILLDALAVREGEG